MDVNYADLVWSIWPWGKVLIGLGAAILVAIVFCTTHAGDAYRTGLRQTFNLLPARLDSEGLLELRDRPLAGPQSGGRLQQVLKAGLVTGRGGLLISKSAVLAAWESERERYRMWPRVVLGLGLVSLALGLLAASHQLPFAMRQWILQNQQEALQHLETAHALLTWGLTNGFIGLLLYFAFDRITQAFFNRTSRGLVQYLGAAEGSETADPGPRPALPTAVHSAVNEPLS